MRIRTGREGTRLRLVACAFLPGSDGINARGVSGFTELFLAMRPC